MKIVMITVIVAALALLTAAIVFPMFAMGEPSTPKTVCLSNVKQLVLASIMYSTDMDDKAPPHEIWMDALGPYAKSDWIFHCPTVKTQDAYGYAFNAGVYSLDDKNPYPSTTPLIYDSLSLGRNPYDPVGSLPVPGRHDGFDNVGFLDGHARSVPVPAR